MRFADAETFERAAQQLVDRGVLHLLAKTLPPSLQSFPLRIVFPDGSSVAVQARLQTLKGLAVVVQVVEGKEAFATAWKGAKQRASGAERRRAQRKRVTHPVQFQNELCTTFDISKSGMCLVSESVYPVGTVLQGRILVDGDWADFEVEVRWSRLNDPNQKGRENLGVRFVRVPAGYDRLLAANVDAKKAAQHPAATPPAVPATPASAQPPLSRRLTPRADERRRRPRLRYRHRVSIGSVRGFTINVSNEGFAVETQRVLAPGSEVTGVFYIDTQELLFSGQVRWARAGNQGLGILGQMGVQFRQAPRGLIELLTRK